MPSAPAASAVGPVKLGPATAPIVVAHTTSDNARPRTSFRARSTAVYRARPFAAVVKPSRAEPARSRANEPATAASAHARPPAAPTA